MPSGSRRGRQETSSSEGNVPGLELIGAIFPGKVIAVELANGEGESGEAEAASQVGVDED